MSVEVFLSGGKLWLLLIICILFVLVHLAKMARLYLIVIDEGIPLKKFLFCYFLTTLVNLMVPYKLGEFFRLFVFSKVTKSLRIGVLSVVLDRFFDTVALVLILLPYELLTGGKVTNSTLALAAFVVVAVFVYLSCFPCYRYLNRYIIMNRSSKRAISGLKFIERIRTEYDYVKSLIDGRSALLVIFSFAAWLLECGILHLFALISGEQGADFSAYIGAIFSFGQSELMRTYITFGIAVMGMATSVSVIMILASRNDKKEMV